LYKRLRKIGGAAAGDWALDFLEARLQREKRTERHHSPDLLVEILMREKLFDRAWSTARKHGVSTGLKESLARASEVTHRELALETYLSVSISLPLQAVITPMRRRWA
jgi:hypothetical protein